jgi:hypothetical protein
MRSLLLRGCIPTNCCVANFRENADLDPVTSA